MNNYINLTLTEDARRLLKAVKGGALEKQLSNSSFANSAIGRVFLKFSNGYLSLFNSYDMRANGAEYPTLQIENSDGTPKWNKEKYTEKIIDKVVMEIVLIRDHLEWEWAGKYWVMDNDIGIKFIFENREMLYAVEDSMGETFSFFDVDPNKEKISYDYAFDELWSFKENVLKKFERTEIPL